MGTSLALFEQPSEDLALVDQLVNIKAFLPTLRMFDGSSKPCKEGIIPVGHFGLTTAKDTIEDLGKRVVFIPLQYQGKAMLLDSNNKPLKITNKPGTPDYDAIVATARQGGRNGAMVGPEFLYYLPEKETFCTHFLVNNTAKKQYEPLKSVLGKVCVFEYKLERNDKGTWAGFKLARLDVEVTLPPEEQCLEAKEQFLNCVFNRETNTNAAPSQF